ncbi:MAG: hypothetical protein KDA69_01245 [Planctomycetaceae bacterium]|nr:hypothetical protein [Planctomycetaceae bacterium]
MVSQADFSHGVKKHHRWYRFVFSLSALCSASLALLCMLLMLMAFLSGNSTVQFQFLAVGNRTVDVEVKQGHLTVVSSRGAHLSSEDIDSVFSSIAAGKPVLPHPTSMRRFNIGFFGFSSLAFGVHTFRLIHISIYILLPIFVATFLYCVNGMASCSEEPERQAQ